MEVARRGKDGRVDVDSVLMYEVLKKKKNSSRMIEGKCLRRWYFWLISALCAQIS